MIFVTDKGRMANNMFQYGHVYAWGREHGRSTMSMRFAYKYPDFRISTHAITMPSFTSWLSWRLSYTCFPSLTSQTDRLMRRWLTSPATSIYC